MAMFAVEPRSCRGWRFVPVVVRPDILVETRWVDDGRRSWLSYDGLAGL